MKAPTIAEIKKVEAWHEERAFKKANALAEKGAKTSDKWTFYGFPVNERFSKKALIGMAIAANSSGGFSSVIFGKD